MITAIDSYALSRPEDYGFPGEAELRSRLGAYFPEYAQAAPGAAPATADGARDGAALVGSSMSGAALAGNSLGGAAYSPVVEPCSQAGAFQEDAFQASRPGAGRRAAPRAKGGPAYVGELPVERIRADFPILSEYVEGKPLVWLDNAATTQRPRQVIERLAYYYQHENSNVHRGAHALAARSTDAYEAARGKVAAFIGAPSKDNIVFVRGATEGLNLIAHSFVKPRLGPGDEIVLTVLEHHANIVPWQLVAQETGAALKVAPVDETGQIILSEYAALFGPRTKFASVAQVSNALGTVTPIAEMIAIAHGFGVPVAVDGAQSVSHMPVSVAGLDADFFVFSGHKVFGPTGIGAVYGKSELLEEARPYQGGGNMIADVTFERTAYHPAPQKFEAGTGSIADAVGLGAAIDYVSALGMASIAAYEGALLEYGARQLARIPGLRLIGTAREKASVLSFVLDNRSVEETGKYLSQQGIALRAGHHCAQPILRRFGLEATVRPSLAFYNTVAEVDFLAEMVEALVGRRMNNFEL